MANQRNCRKFSNLWAYPLKISNIYPKKDDKVCFDDKTNANTFKEFFCNVASDLVAKLPPPSNGFGLPTVRSYFQDILGLFPSKFKFSNVTEDLYYSY